ncbi:hypothetical protein ACN27F_13840 [Solwaraspora sp. WMMB335]|uniref:hypothetical protein n=1 Tax=Solwaraspora sp. WMMB335 TaxID=3404118 RepID=UPI003B952397
MRRLDDSRPGDRTGDADRFVDLGDDGGPLLPEQTSDDTDRGWGERVGDDEWLLAERPPHWD